MVGALIDGEKRCVWGSFVLLERFNKYLSAVVGPYTEVFNQTTIGSLKVPPVF